MHGYINIAMLVSRWLADLSIHTSKSQDPWNPLSLDGKKSERSRALDLPQTFNQPSYFFDSNAVPSPEPLHVAIMSHKWHAIAD